jgi:hypothetical protein
VPSSQNATPPKRGIFSKFHPPLADEIYPSRRLWRPQKNAFPKGRLLPLKAGGDMLRVLESKNGKADCVFGVATLPLHKTMNAKKSYAGKQAGIKKRRAINLTRRLFSSLQNILFTCI